MNGTSTLDHIPASEIPHILQTERAKRIRWEFENSLRRHNHLGLAVGLLSALARASVNNDRSTGNTSGGLWESTVEDAKSKMKVRIERRRELLAMAGKSGKSMPGGFGDMMDLDDS